MSVSILEFWKLAVASGLLSPARCQQLHAQFSGLNGASQQANLGSLTQWLVAQRVLSRYQAEQLAAGRPGPFVFGEYTIVKRLKSGRFTGMFRARHTDGSHALLTFGVYLANESEDADELAQRAIVASQIISPHVSHVLQLVDSDPLTIAVDELSGHTLLEHLAAGKKPSLTTACRIGFQAALGLVALHSARQVHGGVWPENLWVDASGTIKVLQFPLVSGAGLAPRRELPAADYLAPELSDADQPCTVQTDIYALGATLYQLIAGRMVFEGGTAEEKIRRHLNEVPARLDRLVPGVPEELADLVAEMLDKEPMIRCQSAHQAAHLLSRFVSSSKGRGVTPPRINDSGPAVGFGAWQAPAWEAPPQLPSGTPVSAAVPGEPVSQSARSLADSKASVPPPATSNIPPAPEPPPAAPTWPAAPNLAQSSPLAAVAPSIVITPLPTSHQSATVRQRRSPAIWIGVGMVGLLAATGAMVSLFSSSVPPPVSATVTHAIETAASAPQVAAEPTEGLPAGAPVALRTDEVEDDGRLLWRGPTAGEPLALDYLPSGAQALIALRPAELLSGEDGAKLAESLGPGKAGLAMLREVLGVPVDQIEQLLVAFYSDEAGSTQAAFVMRTVGDISAAQLPPAWGQPIESEANSKKYWKGMERSYWFPHSDDRRLVAIAPNKAMADVLKREGPALVRGGFERLLRHSDRTRQFTLIWAPSYLNTDGKNLLVGELDQLREPLARFFDESIEAVLLSGHRGEEGGQAALFLELRAVAPPETKPNELAVQLRQRVSDLPQQIAAQVAGLPPQPYSRQVVDRFPKMLQLLDQYTRSGVDDRQAVLNAYLPGAAAHNLILATELLLAMQDGDETTMGGSTASNSPATGATAALDRTISLSFPRESLDRCLEQLAAELGVTIEIAGTDLQLEGITKNQSLNNLDVRDRPAREVLARVLELANPEGKLVYVIVADAGQGEVIRITTRAAAAKRGDRLPAEFIEKTSAGAP